MSNGIKVSSVMWLSFQRILLLDYIWFILIVCIFIRCSSYFIQGFPHYNSSFMTVIIIPIWFDQKSLLLIRCFISILMGHYSYWLRLHWIWFGCYELLLSFILSDLVYMLLVHESLISYYLPWFCHWLFNYWVHHFISRHLHYHRRIIHASCIDYFMGFPFHHWLSASY